MADAGAMPDNAAEIAVANAINNINGRNRLLAGGAAAAGGGGAGAGGAAGGGGAAAGVGAANMGQNNVMNMRDRLFHAIYFRVAATYAELVPRKVQLAIEFLLLAKALVFFLTLVYVHTAFIKNPCTCLQEIENWPREGVIRVEIIPHLAKKRDIWQRIKSDQQVVKALRHTYHYGIGPQTRDNHKRMKRYEVMLRKLGVPKRTNLVFNNETMYFYFDVINLLDNYDQPSAIPLNGGEDEDEQYIVEYSLEYGHLRLSSATRKRLNIPVLTVQLDPNTNECFGDDLTRYLLKNLLGYDDLLMASVRVIAEKEDNKGYLRNVITGEHYRFVSIWWAAWSSYPAAFCVMLLFTFSVSMLLRYSHHQIFVFIVDLLQMLEYNISARFPIAPLLTVILALVGMEAIMSEFFNDTTTAFYIILIVWIADQFDAICCHTSITKRHWLRFFYLYHFAFYAYHYRFSGQYRTLALLSSYLFIQHSMVFFFHRYELPAIMAQRNVFFVTRNQPNAAAAGAGAGPGAAGAGAAGAAAGQQAAVQRARVIVARIFSQLAAQRQNLAAGGAPAPAAGGAAVGAGADAAPAAAAAAAAAPPPATAAAGVVMALGNWRRLPLLGDWLQGRQQFATVRRVFMGQGHGHGQMMHVRLQRINVADIPGLQTRAAAAAATVAAAPATAATIADVESNHGQGRREGAEPAINSINDAGVSAGGAGAGEAEAGIEAAAEAVTTTAEAAQDKVETEEQRQELAGVPKTLKNLNSVTADIINLPDTKTTTTSATRTTIGTEAEELSLLAMAKQLANNLPTRRTNEKEPLPSGEKQSNNSCSSSDQQRQNQATATTSKQSRADAAETELESAGASLGLRPAFTASTAAVETVPVPGAMMDGRQTVDFIEGDSFTSTANYDAAVNHMEEEEQKQKQQAEKLMKTQPHTSNQVTTAAATTGEAATTE